MPGIPTRLRNELSINVANSSMSGNRCLPCISEMWTTVVAHGGEDRPRTRGLCLIELDNCIGYRRSVQRKTRAPPRGLQLSHLPTRAANCVEHTGHNLLSAFFSGSGSLCVSHVGMCLYVLRLWCSQEIIFFLCGRGRILL